MKTLLTIGLGSALLLGGCASEDITMRDVRGNYATSSQFASESRDEFVAAIDDGLDDYDRRFYELRAMTGSLNEDARDEFTDYAEELESQRSIVKARLARLESALPEEWRDQREDVRDAYVDLRELLDEAFEDVTEEL